MFDFHYQLAPHLEKQIRYEDTYFIDLDNGYQ
jgi:hypothetical protein